MLQTLASRHSYSSGKEKRVHKAEFKSVKYEGCLDVHKLFRIVERFCEGAGRSSKILASVFDPDRTTVRISRSGTARGLLRTLRW